MKLIVHLVLYIGCTLSILFYLRARLIPYITIHQLTCRLFVQNSSSTFFATSVTAHTSSCFPVVIRRRNNVCRTQKAVSLAHWYHSSPISTFVPIRSSTTLAFVTHIRNTSFSTQ